MDSAVGALDEFLRHEGFVQRLARSLVATEDEADDLVQETWLRAIQRRPTTAHSPAGWLGTVMRNLRRDRSAQQVQRERREASLARPEATPPLQQVVERQEAQRQIVSALKAIPEAHATAIVLRFLDGLPPREIAKRLSLPVETVKKHLTRGLSDLREKLDETFDGGREGWLAALPLIAVAPGAGSAGKATIAASLAALFASTMAKWFLGVGVIGLAAFIIVASILSEPRPQRPHSLASESDEPATAAVPQTAARTITPRPFSEVAEPAEVNSDTPPSNPAASRSAEVTITGRVADENDQALAGVVVRVAAYKVWTEGIDVPRLPGKVDLRGFEMTTGVDGRFRFDGPVPTTESLRLTLEPDPFHDSEFLILGGNRAGARAPLHAGENDFGTIRLVTTGAIRGSVRDEASAPIADAKLMLGPSRSSTLSRDAFSDANGKFVVGHSPAGPMGLTASAEGYLSEFRKPIDVALRRFTDNVDFVLRKAPTLSGVIVDDEGSPIEGARLWGWPASSGSGAGGKSGADGTFAVALPQEEAYTLEVTREGYESFGVGNRSTRYPPGARDLRIMMKRLASSTLLVVDAKTGQPITKFGHAMVPNMSNHSTRAGYIEVASTPLREHAGGRVIVSFRPGIDVVDVSARGYESQRFDPEPGAAVDGVFVVKLARGGSVFGRVQIAGVPAGGVALRLEPGRIVSTSMPGSKLVPGQFIPQRDGAVLSTSALDGTFRLENAPGGSVRLIARAVSGEVACVAPFQVEPSSAVDLGTIDLFRGAVLRGVVLVPAGRRPIGLIVRLDEPFFGESQVTDADGRFSFSALIPGAHQLMLPEVPGSIGKVPPLEVQLVAGEVREVELDARDSGTCRVDLTILIGGRPAVNRQVWLEGDGGRKSLDMGITDGSGRLAGSAPVESGLGVRIGTPYGMLKHPTASLDLTLDAIVVQTIRYETSSVVVVLPNSVTLPARCIVRFELTSAGTSIERLERSISLSGGMTQEPGISASEGGHRLQFDDVPVGDWRLLLEVADASASPAREQSTAYVFSGRLKPMFSATAALRLVSGLIAIAELR